MRRNNPSRIYSFRELNKLGNREVSRMIDRIILGLRPSEELTRRVARLADAGWTYEDIAAEFGVTVSTVSQRLKRHRRASK